METFWFFRLRFRQAYDSAYNSDFRFSLGHKLSYDADFDSDCDASENQPLTCNPKDTEWGPKCNPTVTKHTHKWRTNVCLLFVLVKLLFTSMLSLQAKFSLIPLISLSDSTLKLSAALAISSAFWQSWRWNWWNNSNAHNKWFDYPS